MSVSAKVILANANLASLQPYEVGILIHITQINTLRQKIN